MYMNLLRWSLALVLGAGGAALLVTVARGGHPGVPDGVALALGGAELVAAGAFLVPRATRIGGLALLVVLAAAAALHAVAGHAPPAGFVIYAAAIAVVVAHHPERAA